MERSWRAARSKTIRDDRLVPEEGVLHARLPMVARRRVHRPNRAIASGRPRFPSRHGGRPSWRNDDRRATRTRDVVDGDRVVGRVPRDAGEATVDGSDQVDDRRRVIDRRLRQCVGDDHPRSVNIKMELLPAARTLEFILSVWSRRMDDRANPRPWTSQTVDSCTNATLVSPCFSGWSSGRGELASRASIAARRSTFQQGQRNRRPCRPATARR